MMPGVGPGDGQGTDAGPAKTRFVATWWPTSPLAKLLDAPVSEVRRRLRKHNLHRLHSINITLRLP